MCQREQELRDILPDRLWTVFESVSWDDILPDASKQLTDVAPLWIGGTCAIQSYSEVLTAHLRRYAATNEFRVDLAKLISLAAGKGFLTATGSSVTAVGRKFAQEYGIPIEGAIPTHSDEDEEADERLYLADADPTDTEAYVLGTTVKYYGTKPLPFGALTAAEAGMSMDYREHLCDCLNIGPVVLCMDLQPHYALPRQEGEPYRQRNIPNPDSTVLISHCVTAYGYECPDGTVRSLKLMYQENAEGAPGDEPQRGLYIDPDVFYGYYVPILHDMRMSKTPAEGYKTTHLSPQPSPPSSPPTSIWQRIRRAFL